MATTQKTVTSLELTGEQRSRIAEELGLSHKMEKVPARLTVAGISSADLAGRPTVGGGHAIVAVIA
jgi:hypothetical protein